jgi:uncharacterized protein (TIGR00299 family) protein
VVSERVAWFDVSAGVAGDMVCAALVDAGVPLEVLQAAVDAVVPGEVRWERAEVLRAGRRGTHLTAVTDEVGSSTRAGSDVMALVRSSTLEEPVAASALAVLSRLIEAEARVHGVSMDQVHLHEAGSLDAIADIVGACAALHHLGITRALAGTMAVGSGSVRTAHGELPVPVPAVVELTRGWQVGALGEGELATPTGAALITTLAAECASLPVLHLEAAGTGAGTNDRQGVANVVRVLVGRTAGEVDGSGTLGTQHLLETNVDDLDPRVWPGVLASLLDAGAADAWLTPILMKKGRPAHTLSVLVGAPALDPVRRLILSATSTIGLREHVVTKHALTRLVVEVAVDGVRVRIKVAHTDGRIVHAAPEWDDVAALAEVTGRPARAELERCVATMVERGYVGGAPVPGRSDHER